MNDPGRRVAILDGYRTNDGSLGSGGCLLFVHEFLSLRWRHLRDNDNFHPKPSLKLGASPMRRQDVNFNCHRRDNILSLSVALFSQPLELIFQRRCSRGASGATAMSTEERALGSHKYPVSTK